jgi:hypothetical protein
VPVGDQELAGAVVTYVGNQVRLTLHGATRTVATDNVRRLDPLFATAGDVSPDGRTLLYLTADAEDYHNMTVTAVDLKTLQKHVLVQVPSDFWLQTPRWSPNSQWVAYVIQNAVTRAPEVWIANLAGTQHRLVVANKVLTVRSMEGLDKRAPSWSADGKNIVFYDNAYRPTTQYAVSVATGALSAAVAPTPDGCIGGCFICTLPSYLQTNTAWKDIVMQSGGDTIGNAGCALTSLTDLFDYYGSTVGNPGGMANCLNPWGYAEPLNWSGAQVNPPNGPGCDKYTTNFISSQAFGWSTLDSYLQHGHPVIVEVCQSGCSQTHFFVVVGGDGTHNEQDYSINDPARGDTATMDRYASWSLNWMILYQPGSGTWPRCE